MDTLELDLTQFGGIPIAQGNGGETTWSFGWVNNPTYAASAIPLIEQAQGFPVDWQSAFSSSGANDDDDEDVFLWQAEEKLQGKLMPSWNQSSVGSCVAFGNGRAANDLLCIQALQGHIEWPRDDVATEPIYGGSRVEVGRGVLGNSDGSMGSWAATWLLKWGVLLRRVYGSEDLRSYSVDRCRSYGVRGCPDALEPIARQFPVKGVALVTTGDALWQALGNYYPVAVCSNRGFNTPLRDGFCEPRDVWNHCVKPDALIAGKRFKRADEIEVGDQVYSRDGELHAVTEIHKRDYKGTMVRLSVTCGTPLEVTENHPVLIYRKVRKAVASTVRGMSVAKETNMPDDMKYRWEDYIPLWVAAKDVRPGDYLVTPGVEENKEVEVPCWPTNVRALKQIPPLELNPEVAYLMGFYIGDGNVKKNHGIGLTLSLKDDYQRLMNAIRCLGIEPRLREFDTYRRILVDSVILAEAFEEWFGKNSYTKQIPDWLMRGEFISDVIEGILDSDGCRYKGRHVVTSTSWVLANQLYMSLTKEGFRPYLSKTVRGASSYPNGAPAWSVTWHPTCKRSRVRRKDGLNLRKVKTTMLLPYEGEVYNYDVEDTHDYVCDGYVVHNCMEYRGRFIHPSQGKCVITQNSWGDYLKSKGNPHSMIETRKGKVQLPDGCFATPLSVAAAMVAQRDSYALSEAQGFPRRRLFFW